MPRRVTEAEFQAWAAAVWFPYVHDADTVRTTRFEISLAGIYRVWRCMEGQHTREILYEGPDFEEAMDAWEGV